MTYGRCKGSKSFGPQAVSFRATRASPFLKRSEQSEKSTFVVHPFGSRYMPSQEIDDLESLVSNDAPLHTVYSGTRPESVLAARSIIRVSATPSSCTTTRRSDIALLRRSSHRATTGLSPRSAILWSAVADR